MSLPLILKNFNLYGDGNDWRGCVSSVKLPKLTHKNEKVRAAGMLGDVDVSLGIETLNTEFTCDGFVASSLKLFGDQKHDARIFRFAGAVQAPDSEEYLAVEAIMRGRLDEVDFGDSQLGKKTEHKYKITHTTYKLIVAGETIYDIDMVRGKFISGGVDKTAGMRSAIGM